MVWLDLAAAGALLVTLGAIGLLWQTGRALPDLEDTLQRAEARGREQALRLEMLNRLRDGQKFAEQAIESGTAITRTLHHGISRIPFSILENIPPTAPVAKVVRQVHDAISNDIYSAINALNRGVGQQLRGSGEKQAEADRKEDNPQQPPEGDRH